MWSKHLTSEVDCGILVATVHQEAAPTLRVQMGRVRATVLPTTVRVRIKPELDECTVSDADRLEYAGDDAVLLRLTLDLPFRACQATLPRREASRGVRRHRIFQRRDFEANP